MYSFIKFDSIVYQLSFDNQLFLLFQLKNVVLNNKVGFIFIFLVANYGQWHQIFW